MPDTPRFFRYAVLVAMFPVAALGLVGRFWPMPSSAGCFCLAPGAIVR